MQKLILLFALFLASSAMALTMEENHNILYVESLNHLNNREYKEGITALEKIFKETKDEKLKAEVAYLLVITKYDTRKGMRSNYGKYAYKNYTTISHKKRMDLARLTADLFFQEGELEDAYFFYKEIFTNKDAPFEFREYAVYKGGWVLVNQENYEEIFSVWSDWLIKNNGGELYELIVHDYAKFYYEFYVVKNSKDLKFHINFPEDHRYYPKLLEGMVDGFKRYAFKSPIDPLKHLTDFHFYTPLLNAVLKDSNYFHRKPCSALPFIQKANLSKLNMDAAMDTTNTCFSEYRPYIMGQKDGVAKVINEGKLNLAKTYPLLDTKGTRNFIKGEYLFLTKNYPEACKSFLKGFNSQNLKKIEYNALSKGLNALGNACLKSEASKVSDELTAFYEKFLSSDIFLDHYKKNNEIRNTFNNIIILPGHINLASNSFLKNVEKWNEEELLAYIVEKSKDSKTLLFNIFYSLNYDITKSKFKVLFLNSIHELIEKKDYLAANDLLNHFVPVSSADSEFTKLWYLLSETEFQKGTAFPQNYVIASRFEELTSDKNLSKDDKKFLAFYLIMNGKTQKVLDRWNDFKSYIHSDVSLTDKLVQTFIEDKNLKVKRSVKKDPIYTFAKDAEQIIQTSSHLNKSLIVPRAVRKTPFGKDFYTIALTHNANREITAAKSKKNSDKQLIKLLKVTKYAYDTFANHKWSSEKNYELSKKFLVTFLDNFINFAQNMKASKEEEKNQVAQLVQVLTSWKESV